MPKDFEPTGRPDVDPVTLFEPSDHYWLLAGDESRLWSSAVGAYVPSDHHAYLAWRGRGVAPTPIANEFELDQMLRQYGHTIGRAFPAAEALAALTIIDRRKVKAALGRDDIADIRDEDAEKLFALSASLQPSLRKEPQPPRIEGVGSSAIAAA